jgi:hypothetical protein
LVFSDLLFEQEGRRRRAHPHRFLPAGINGMPPQEVQKRLFLGNFIPCITAVIPVRVLEEVGLFDEKVQGGPDDFELFLRIAGHFRLYYLDEPLAVKRIHGGNYSLMPRMEEDLLYIARKMAGLFPALAALESRRRSIIYETQGYFCCNTRDYRRAAGYYRAAIKERPLNPFNWLKLLGALLGRWAGPRVQDAYFGCGKWVSRKVSHALGRKVKAGDRRS